MFSDLLLGFAATLEPTSIMMIAAGTALGIFVGALPGLSSPMAIIVLLPLTYSFPTLPALMMMMGVYVGTKLGGSFSAILLRTPGTPAGACTALDGYPMAQRGEAGLALGYAVMGSTLGGIFGWVIAITCVPLLATVAMKAASADIALIGVLGLIMVTAFIRASMLRGLIGVTLGLLIATVGIDPVDGTERFTFGTYQLQSGIPFAAALVGFFGFAVVLSDTSLIGTSTEAVTQKVRLVLPKMREVFSRWRAIVIGAGYGVGIGAIPGVGAEASPWMAYGTVRNQSKNPEAFGTGEPSGILAPESNNNASCGGTMVPMLTLGIPGDGTTAVMLGALILHGVAPGVTLMRDEPVLVWGLLASLLVATVFMFLIAWPSITLFVRVLGKDRGWLFPFILVLATLGAFASMNDFFPVWVALACGVLGWVLESHGFPTVTVVLGIILGPIIEQNARLALSLSQNDWGVFVGTVPRMLIAALIVGLIAWELWRHLSKHLASPRKQSVPHGGN
ncbi:tripartite tricarboxylate transporter permease [Pseudazoarcus pumilus]|uniref:C4-dicarboxylate ABC transporter permease n=1 Tax=Pseudazoarcus pumilus TaxID=2067960 RepID=A0A2I6S375_9RHOO|nr:tripartite tricarboxylate transporter permease [Pseudazoarcus pumilus]AUN93703.1 C4-dicarboxylate ABC transporter permease [Pseudazoarcus pumilus]